MIRHDDDDGDGGGNDDDDEEEDTDSAPPGSLPVTERQTCGHDGEEGTAKFDLTSSARLSAGGREQRDYRPPRAQPGK